MRISDSNVNMASKRNYEQYGASGSNVKKDGMKLTIREDSDSMISWSSILQKKAESSGNALPSETYSPTGKDGRIQKTAWNGLAPTGTGSQSGIRDSVLNSLFDRFRSAGAFSSPIGGGFGSMGFSGGSTVYSTLSYYEAEQTSFSASGTARTEDGREINFNIDVAMSRSFAQYTQTVLPNLMSALTDPLMLNVGSDVTHISDQKFKFDLDCDGTEDEISLPTKGTGFLALDKNEDGTINDGNELFGTKSGDGFKDLSEYDSDGNGWIDENDDIFTKLKVWYKNEDGTDELIDLKEAGIGAIYLGSQETEFSLKGAGNGLNGVVRSTGFFLREDGSAGTIQHVDLATTPAATGSDYEPLSVPVDEFADEDGEETISWEPEENRRRTSNSRNSESRRAREERIRKHNNEVYEKRAAQRRRLRKKEFEKTQQRRKERIERYEEHLQEVREEAEAV